MSDRNDVLEDLKTAALKPFGVPVTTVIKSDDGTVFVCTVIAASREWYAAVRDGSEIPALIRERFCLK